MNSYIGLLNKMEEFCNNHAMVMRFGADFSEQMGNFATLSEEFPIVFVSPVNKQMGQFTNTFTIDVYCWDIIQKDRANINTCLSDTDLILTDIWTDFFNGDDYTISVVGLPPITPLNNGLLDYTVGNMMTLQIEVDTYCPDAIPRINGVTPIPTQPTSIADKLMKTNQTTSYRTGDDGDLQSGREVDFFTLSDNNPFGNTNRFTDELGGTSYSNNIAIDWSTYDGDEVLGYYTTEQGTDDWNDAIDNALAFSASTFTSGWRLPNWQEMTNIMAIGYNRALNYPPFYNSGNSRFWTSSTLDGYTTQPLVLLNQWQMVGNTPGSNYNWYPVRFFTLTELGL